MKKLDILYITLFMLMLTVPLVFLNTQPGLVSDIDNRVLAERPALRANSWDALEESMKGLESYVDDRIGFRNELILANTVLNDRLFGYMAHPSYAYGLDGHIFYRYDFAPLTAEALLDTYTGFVQQMHRYCEERGVPFYYVLTPSKELVYPEFLPPGVENRMTVLFSAYERVKTSLRADGVHVVDMTDALLAAKESGIPVMQKKYDVGHWNSLGAFYGASALMNEVKKDIPSARVPSLDQYDSSEVIQTSLMVSKVPIHEPYTVLTPKAAIPFSYENDYCGLRTSSHAPDFYGHYSTEAQDAPTALVLHGSHMAQALDFLAPQFSESLFLSSYETIVDLPYYFNIIQPDLVIYEVNNRTFTPDYWDVDTMETRVLPAPIQSTDVLDKTDVYSIGRGIRAKSPAEDTNLVALSVAVQGPEVNRAYIGLGGTWLDAEIGQAEESDIMLSATTDKRMLVDVSEAVLVVVSEGEKMQEFSLPLLGID